MGQNIARSLNPVHGAEIENVTCDGGSITFTDPITGQYFHATGRIKQLSINARNYKEGTLIGAIELYKTRIMAPYEIDFVDTSGQFRYLPAIIPDSFLLIRFNEATAVFETPFGEEVLARAEGCAWDSENHVFCGFIGEEMFVYMPFDPY